MLKDEFNNFSICKVKPRVGRLVNDTCKYYRRYRYRYVLLKVSTIPIPILLQKISGDTFADNF